MEGKKILTIVAYVLLIAVIVVGALFLFGVFDKNSTKLPIVYPDNNVNWVEYDNGMLRASFDDKLDITQEDIMMRFTINDLVPTSNSGDVQTGLQILDDKDLAYTTYYGDTSLSVEVEEETYEYQVSIKLYNHATLTDNGDITSGDGFVIEFSNLEKYDDDLSTYTPVEITSLKILAIYEASDNVALL